MTLTLVTIGWACSTLAWFLARREKRVLNKCLMDCGRKVFNREGEIERLQRSNANLKDRLAAIHRAAELDEEPAANRRVELYENFKWPFEPRATTEADPPA